MTTKPIAQQVILLSLLLSSEILAYPVFGTKRYARSTGMPAHRIQSWAPLPIQPYQSVQPTTPNQFLAPTYYTDYPYDTEYYYPPEPAYSAYPPYPAPYYPTAVANDNLKYGIYHSLLPYYYDARRPGYAYYGYDGYDETSDPVDDIHEEMQQEEERKEREDALPIGQETWFENSGSSSQQPEQESIADVNAAFLQNLILSQMYNDAQTHESSLRQQQLRLAGYGDEVVDDWVYADTPKDEQGAYYPDEEDEDVKELKSLVKKPNVNSDDRFESVIRRRQEILHRNNAENTESKQRYPTWSDSNDKESRDFARVFGSQMMKKSYDQWLPAELDTINYSDRKKILPASEQIVVTEAEAEVVTTPVTISTTEAPDFDPRRGQKEVPLLRPAMPARHPVFKDAMDELMKEEAHRNKASVYETIKKLLNMEEVLREDHDENWRPQPKKRFVSNEESLVEQLGGLKKDLA